MKKKLLSMTLGMMLVISAAVPAMAAEAPVSEGVPAVAISTVATQAADGEYKEGLNVLIQMNKQTQDKQDKFIEGTLSKEDVISVMDDLKWNQEEKDALLKGFDKSMDVQNELYALYKGDIEQATMEKADKLKEELQGIFSEEFLNKAVEKELLSELTMIISYSVSTSDAAADGKTDKTDLNEIKLFDIKDGKATPETEKGTPAAKLIIQSIK